jgi:transcriptional accessory protein Tex/SPT6
VTTEHSAQPTIFDALAAIEARDAAIIQVDFNADPQWKKAADMAIRAIAMDRPEMTTDDVWRWLHEVAIEAPHEPRALGAAMKRAAREGIIVATDRVKQSARPECHARPVRVWKSLLSDLS